MEKEKKKNEGSVVIGHWSRLFPSETSLLWPQRLAAENLPSTSTPATGATALTCPGSHPAALLKRCQPGWLAQLLPAHSIPSTSWLLSGQSLVLSGAGGKT